MRFHRRYAALACLALLAACRGGAQQGASHESTALPAPSAHSVAHAANAGPAPLAGHFSAPAYGVSLDFPPRMQAQRQFSAHYLANASWKLFAPPGSHGKALLELALPDSNQVTAGMLRLGVSRGRSEVDACTAAPDAARITGSGHARIAGQAFTTYSAGDEAMNHFLNARSYRTVYHGACIAIDLIVTGTHPSVYSPPAHPPFSRRQAFARLQPLLDGLHLSAPRKDAASQ